MAKRYILIKDRYASEKDAVAEAPIDRTTGRADLRGPRSQVRRRLSPTKETAMSTLDAFIPEPRLCEVDSIEVPVPASAAFATVRHFDIASVPFAALLFSLRTASRPKLSFDDIGRSATGFHVLFDDERRLVVGAIGRFWLPKMEFADVPADRFLRFDEPGWGKLAWELRSEETERGARLVFELRLTATDEEAFRSFRRYYRAIAPFSRFFRRVGLRSMKKTLVTPDPREATRPLLGDLLIADPKAEATDVIEIDAPPSAVWPWLVQMGCGRAGWYSYDDLDNAGVRSETELVPELQRLRIGDVLPATPKGDDGFTVLVLEPQRALVLGAHVDTESDRALFFGDPKPAHFFQSTWAFVLEPLSYERTRLLVRARVDYGPKAFSQRVGVRALGLVHHFMERAQLEHLKERVEGRAQRASSTWHDVAAGVTGALIMLLDFATPFLRGARSHWGHERRRCGATSSRRPARAGAALAMDACDSHRRAARASVALGRPARSEQGGLLQLSAAREPRRM
jgi:hypothetical protein